MEHMYPKIMLVDDDAEDRQIIKDTFDDLDYGAVIHFEENGEEAIKYLQQCTPPGAIPSLIILDLNMPKMNGTQTLRFLKAEPAFAAIPVIIFSTSLNPIERDECLTLGAHSYVIKPISYTQTVEVVRHFYNLCNQLSQVE
ncbi:response regulator [Chitinophaga agrisoli]|uniref:Response regulator n=1 Tax=Chitinophaga agrisoli TaxID=2607653 RepID=A0A5B2VNT3_9BACT|nr:response regulator [Chitinophaga agrisoli]KAA2241343.1 response regulator [Chitinophaga agrisoli]